MTAPEWFALALHTLGACVGMGLVGMGLGVLVWVVGGPGDGE